MKRKIVLELTRAEARGLESLAGEGYAAMSTDEEAAKAYLGNKREQEAAWDAYRKLRVALGYHQY